MQSEKPPGAEEASYGVRELYLPPDPRLGCAEGGEYLRRKHVPADYSEVARSVPNGGLFYHVLYFIEPFLYRLRFYDAVLRDVLLRDFLNGYDRTAVFVENFEELPDAGLPRDD